MIEKITIEILAGKMKDGTTIFVFLADGLGRVVNSVGDLTTLVDNYLLATTDRVLKNGKDLPK